MGKATDFAFCAVQQAGACLVISIYPALAPHPAPRAAHCAAPLLGCTQANSTQDATPAVELCGALFDDIRYCCLKFTAVATDGGGFAELEHNSSVLVSELISISTGLGWENTALDVMRKVKWCDEAVKMFLGSPVPSEHVPDYTSIIFHPTDLGTIQKKLKSSGFVTPNDWINACRTAFRNALVYSKEGGSAGSAQAILQAAEAASTVFEKEMIRLHGITAIVRRIQTSQDARAAGGAKEKEKSRC